MILFLLPDLSDPRVRWCPSWRRHGIQAPLHLAFSQMHDHRNRPEVQVVRLQKLLLLLIETKPVPVTALVLAGLGCKFLLIK